VGTYGEQAIAYDALEEGAIIEFTQVAQAARKLQEKTGVTRLAFTTLGNNAQDARMQEALSVGGFSEVISLPRAHSLDVLTRDNLTKEALPILYFTGIDEATLIFAGEEIEHYPSLFELYAIDELRKYIEQFDGEVYRVLGHLGKSSQELIADLNDCYIPAQAARVWRNVCDFQQYIPPILYEESFAQSLVIANALTMINHEYDEPEEFQSNLPHFSAPLADPYPRAVSSFAEKYEAVSADNTPKKERHVDSIK
jgi:hypothetical protein